MAAEPRAAWPGTRALIESNADGVYVSAVSIWELGLKHKKGKLPYSIHEMLDGVEALQVALLELRQAHLARFERVELAHKDPFDMLLVGQAGVEQALFMTVDDKILESTYNVHDARQ